MKPRRPDQNHNRASSVECNRSAKEAKPVAKKTRRSAIPTDRLVSLSWC